MKSYINNQIRPAIIEHLQLTLSHVRIAVAWFTDSILFDAINELLSKNISVSLIIMDDEINLECLSQFKKLADRGAFVYFFPKKEGIMHNKFFIIDNKILGMGSYNWTYQAANANFESIIFDEDINSIKLFNKNFIKIRSHCSLLRGEFQDNKISEISNSLYKFCQGGYYGYINKDGFEIVPAIYRHTEDFCEGFAAVVTNNRKYGFINYSGTLVIDAIFDEVKEFSQGLAAVKINNKWGFINRKGNLIIEPKYDKVENFSEDIAVVGNYNADGHFYKGYINMKGFEIYPISCVLALPFSEGYGAIYDGKGCYVDKIGNRFLFSKYYFVFSFKNGYAQVEKCDRFNENDLPSYLIDKNGNEILEISYSSFDVINEDIIQVELNGKYGFINFKGIEITPLIYDEIYIMHEGICSVRINNKIGLIDKYGREICSAIYDRIFPFIGGIAKFEINEKSGFINSQGLEIIPAKYKYADSFNEGLAAVQINGKLGFIDINDNLVIEPIYQYNFKDLWFSIGRFENGLAYLSNGENYGFINKLGEAVTEFIYDEI